MNNNPEVIKKSNNFIISYLTAEMQKKNVSIEELAKLFSHWIWHRDDQTLMSYFSKKQQMPYNIYAEICRELDVPDKLDDSNKDGYITKEGIPVVFPIYDSEEKEDFNPKEVIKDPEELAEYYKNKERTNKLIERIERGEEKMYTHEEMMRRVEQM